MQVAVSQGSLAEIDPDLLVVGLLEGGELPPELAAAPGAADAKGSYKKLSVLHPSTPAHAVCVGLEKREDLEPERLRVAEGITLPQAHADGMGRQIGRAHV